MHKRKAFVDAAKTVLHDNPDAQIRPVLVQQRKRRCSQYAVAHRPKSQDDDARAAIEMIDELLHK
jgi:hypothetical protein